MVEVRDAHESVLTWACMACNPEIDVVVEGAGTSLEKWHSLPWIRGTTSDIDDDDICCTLGTTG